MYSVILNYEKNLINILHLLRDLEIQFFFILAMKAYKPTDATTNPSLILSASQQEQYQHLIEQAVKHGNKTGS